MILVIIKKYLYKVHNLYINSWNKNIHGLLSKIIDSTKIKDILTWKPRNKIRKTCEKGSYKNLRFLAEKSLKKVF